MDHTARTREIVKRVSGWYEGHYAESLAFQDELHREVSDYGRAVEAEARQDEHEQIAKAIEDGVHPLRHAIAAAIRALKPGAHDLPPRAD